MYFLGFSFAFQSALTKVARRALARQDSRWPAVFLFRESFMSLIQTDIYNSMFHFVFFHRFHFVHKLLCFLSLTVRDSDLPHACSKCPSTKIKRVNFQRINIRWYGWSNTPKVECLANLSGRHKPVSICLSHWVFWLKAGSRWLRLVFFLIVSVLCTSPQFPILFAIGF